MYIRTTSHAFSKRKDFVYVRNPYLFLCKYDNNRYTLSAFGNKYIGKLMKTNLSKLKPW